MTPITPAARDCAERIGALLDNWIANYNTAGGIDNESLAIIVQQTLTAEVAATKKAVEERDATIQKMAKGYIELPSGDLVSPSAFTTQKMSLELAEHANEVLRVTLTAAESRATFLQEQHDKVVGELAALKALLKDAEEAMAFLLSNEEHRMGDQYQSARALLPRLREATK